MKRPEARALAERVPGGHSARRKAQGDGPIPGFAGFKLSLRTVWRVRGPQAGFPGDSGPGLPGGSAPLLEAWGLGSGVAREPAFQQLAATWVGGPTGTADSSASGFTCSLTDDARSVQLLGVSFVLSAAVLGSFTTQL